MRAVMAYMATRGNSNEMRQGGNRNNYGEARGYSDGRQGRYNEMRAGENRNEYEEMRGGGYNEMRGNRNETYGNAGDEMRRGGNRNEMAYDMGGEMRRGNRNEMRGEYDGAENRYRGRDGRWKSGRRRSEYDGGEMMTMEGGEMRQYDRRSGGDDDEMEYEVKIKPSNVIEWPYGQPEERESAYRTNRQIGFGSMKMQEKDNEREMQMGKGGYSPILFDRETAEHWVRSMRNEDKNHPVGGKWSPDAIKPMAQKYGIPTDGAKFWEFYAMTNAMYSDYAEVAKKFGITSPEFYACMAKAWLEDQDAEPDKTALYYDCCVKK